jgi:MHS family shikimate/dehydroshikimate transporter-like MFS transporter
MQPQLRIVSGVGKPARRGYIVAGTASMMGTTIEWYDFFLYGTVAALIFNRIFFPSFDPISGTLAAFATYSVGFFARPLGGIVFGHFGTGLDENRCCWSRCS